MSQPDPISFRAVISATTSSCSSSSTPPRQYREVFHGDQRHTITEEFRSAVSRRFRRSAQRKKGSQLLISGFGVRVPGGAPLLPIPVLSCGNALRLLTKVPHYPNLPLLPLRSCRSRIGAGQHAASLRLASRDSAAPTAATLPSSTCAERFGGSFWPHASHRAAPCATSTTVVESRISTSGCPTLRWNRTALKGTETLDEASE